MIGIQRNNFNLIYLCFLECIRSGVLGNAPFLSCYRMTQTKTAKSEMPRWVVVE